MAYDEDLMWELMECRPLRRNWIVFRKCWKYTMNQTGTKSFCLIILVLLVAKMKKPARLYHQYQSSGFKWPLRLNLLKDLCEIPSAIVNVDDINAVIRLLRNRFRSLEQSAVLN